MLEIGYGIGEGIYLFSERYHAKIDGIEISKLMYKIASHRNKKSIEDGKTRLLVGNLDSLEKGIYDFIFLINVVYFWSDLKEKFEKVFKLLKRNGKLMIFMADSEYLMKDKITKTDIFQKYKIEDIKNQMNKLNMKEIKIVEHAEVKGCYYIFGKKISV